MRWKNYLAVGVALAILASSVDCLAERLAVISPVGNVRSGPNGNYAVLWQVEKYYPIEIIRRTGPWCYFKDFEGDEGWIHDSLLGDVATVITKRDACNVRSGPGIRFDLLFTVEKGVPFKVLGNEGDWLHVVHTDGDKGWIHRSLVW